MTDIRFVACALLVATAWATLAFAKPLAPAGAALPVEADWKPRADAWFTAQDETGRRQEMRAMTRALRQPCRYCHTPDFTGYTDRRLVSQQMMALSAEHGVTCADCHAGKTELTPLGQKAAPMWALAREKVMFCGTCHVKHQRFEALTQEGLRFKSDGWDPWRKAYDAAHPTAPEAPPAPRPTPSDPQSPPPPVAPSSAR